MSNEAGTVMWSVAAPDITMTLIGFSTKPEPDQLCHVKNHICAGMYYCPLTKVTDINNNNNGWRVDVAG